MPTIKKNQMIIGGAIAVALLFSGCQPQNPPQTPTETSMVRVEDPSLDNPSTQTEEGVVVGGAMMLPSRPIAVNAADAPNLTSLMSAVQQAGLTETLNTPGPFTVFAPTNAAFEKLPPGTLSEWLEPTNSAALQAVLKYHVVPGIYHFSALEDGGNGQKLTTLQGEQITINVINGIVTLTDSQGNNASIETPDVAQSNGVVYVIDSVLIPRNQE